LKRRYVRARASEPLQYNQFCKVVLKTLLFDSRGGGAKILSLLVIDRVKKNNISKEKRKILQR